MLLHIHRAMPWSWCTKKSLVRITYFLGGKIALVQQHCLTNNQTRRATLQESIKATLMNSLALSSYIFASKRQNVCQRAQQITFPFTVPCPRVDPELKLLSVWSFACSCCVCMGFLQVLPVSFHLLINQTLPLSVNDSNHNKLVAEDK